VSERISNEKLQLERETERMRLKATVRIQSWWRGVMVCTWKRILATIETVVDFLSKRMPVIFKPSYDCIHEL